MSFEILALSIVAVFMVLIPLIFLSQHECVFDFTLPSDQQYGPETQHSVHSEVECKYCMKRSILISYKKGK